MGIPDKYVPQILGALVRAGLVRSKPGRSGGYELAHPPEAISLFDVIEIAEGPIRSQRCVLRSGPCYWGDKCAVHDAWIAAEAALSDRLARTSFSVLAQTDWDIEQGSGGSMVAQAETRQQRVHER
jgi:Rrf2 family protein